VQIVTTPRNRRKWRNLLIQPSFQLRLALIHIVLVVTIVAALFAVLASFLYYDLQSSSSDLWAKYALARLMLVVLERMALAVVLIVALSVVYHIIFSHRLCGPLINIGHTIDAISKGDLTRTILLRRNDFLKDEAARINAMMSSLAARIEQLKVNTSQISAILDALPDQAVKDALRGVVRRNELLLNEWKLDSEADDHLQGSR
jgi:methyl-accepting chemotaxis protein